MATRAEKADHWQRIQGLDRLARPHLAAGLGVPEAYRLAVEEQDAQRAASKSTEKQVVEFSLAPPLK